MANSAEQSTSKVCKNAKKEKKKEKKHEGYTFKKRAGTSGIRGQLYETKLLSLIYFKVLHDDDVEEFYLATNVDEIGIFDDICLRAKLKEFDKPINVFIQAKHRENDKLVTLTSKKDLANCFDSYLKIIRRFQPSNEDALFKGTFCGTDCVFVMYTTAKDEGSSKRCEGSLATYLDNLIGTGNSGSQPSYTDEDMDLLCDHVIKEQLIMLAQKIAKYMNDAKSLIMEDQLVLRYHYLLAQQVFDISEIQPDSLRIAGFREDFFCQSQPFAQIFKDAMCSEILERQIVVNDAEGLLIQFLSKPDDSKILSKLIRGSEITFKNGKLEFRDKMIPQQYKEQLDRINIYKKGVKEDAVEMAVRESIPSPYFNVPALFGNKDIAIRGNDGKIEKRLDHLCTKLTDLIETAKPNNILTLDESLGDGFLRLNGGIASAVGNIFVLDDTSKQYKICENAESLGNIAKRFFTKLQSKIPNLRDYKFVIRGKMFPKLSFTRSEYDDNVVKDFFSKLVFYSNQGDENDVENILKDLIRNSQAHNHHVEIRSEAIFLKCHDQVQKWWMIPKEASYLTKKSKLYKNAVDSTRQSLMGIISMMHKIKYKYYALNEVAGNSLQLQEQTSRTVIITDNSALNVAKLLRHMKNKDLVVLDLEYIVNLPARDYITLHVELTNANEAKTFIIVVDEILNLTTITIERLEKIALTLKDKNYIIVAEQSSVEFVKMFLSLNDNVRKDERNNITDLNEESQENTLEKTKVIFQGVEVSLGDILDNVTITNVEREEIIQSLNSDGNILGKSIVDSNFNITECVDTRLAPVTAGLSVISRSDGTPEIGHRFKRNVHKDELVLSSQLISQCELTGDATVILSNPGMGKTTFLSQLSTVIKQHHPKVWILQINLLEYSVKFSVWKTHKIVIDILECLEFMCQVALSEDENRFNKTVRYLIKLEEAGGIVLKDCKQVIGSNITRPSWTVFELKLFLHYYNTGKVIFLFDGFDEICPHYAYEVLKLIKVLENHPLKHKIWITSRSYEKIVTILELQFGKLYEIVPWSHAESFRFINMIWDSEQILKDLNTDQLKIVYKFVSFMSETYKKATAKKRNDLQIQAKTEIPYSTIYFWFIKYLKVNLTSAPPDVMSSLNKLCEKCDDGSEIMDEFVASPLHLNLISDYLYSKIREINESPNKWYIDTNIFVVYENYLETKFKRIRFEEETQIDTYNPDNIIGFLKECNSNFAYACFGAVYKKLGAYAIFREHCHQLFESRELRELFDSHTMLVEGAEKEEDIICYMVDSIPIFLFSTFAEYLAVEFLCDVLKGSSSEQYKNRIWDFIINVLFFKYNLNVLATLDAKIGIDKELTTLINEKYERVIFELLVDQGTHTEVKSSLCEAVRYDLRNLAVMFLSTIENNLDENNLMDFIKIVKETKLLINAIKMEFEEIIVTIIEHVSVIDKSKLNVLFANYRLNENIDDLSNDEIIHELRKHVWTRMEIVPDLTNSAELSDQIYFI